MFEKIISVLESGPPHERIYALKKLGAEGGTDEKRAAIIRCLKQDPDPVVRHEAAFWLGELGDKDATDALADAALHDRSPLVRHESVEALGWIPTTASRNALEKALNDGDENVRNTAVISLNIHKHPREQWEKSL